VELLAPIACGRFRRSDSITAKISKRITVLGSARSLIDWQKRVHDLDCRLVLAGCGSGDDRGLRHARHADLAPDVMGFLDRVEPAMYGRIGASVIELMSI